MTVLFCNALPSRIGVIACYTMPWAVGLVLKFRRRQTETPKSIEAQFGTVVDPPNFISQWASRLYTNMEVVSYYDFLETLQVCCACARPIARAWQLIAKTCLSGSRRYAFPKNFQILVQDWKFPS